MAGKDWGEILTIGLKGKVILGGALHSSALYISLCQHEHVFLNTVPQTYLDK